MSAGAVPPWGWSVDVSSSRRAATLSLLACAVGIALASGCARAGTDASPAPSRPGSLASSAGGSAVTFAVIGDYGTADGHELAVARLVRRWRPDFVIATGDCCYVPLGPVGYLRTTGAFYGAWLAGVPSPDAFAVPTPRSTNAFFPALGNHDFARGPSGATAYVQYFSLPGPGSASSSGNERYYDFVRGPVHFFVLDSNAQEPDGVTATSRQGRWLEAALAASTSRWNIVYDHHPPFSSDTAHGSTPYMRWPFTAWGADAVISGHAHVYERLLHDGIPYFVNGLGGGTRYTFGRPVPGSAIRYRGDWGAQLVTATDATLEFEFFDVEGALIDHFELPADPGSNVVR